MPFVYPCAKTRTHCALAQAVRFLQCGCAQDDEKRMRGCDCGYDGSGQRDGRHVRHKMSPSLSLTSPLQTRTRHMLWVYGKCSIL